MKDYIVFQLSKKSGLWSSVMVVSAESKAAAIRAFEATPNYSKHRGYYKKPEAHELVRGRVYLV